MNQLPEAIQGAMVLVVDDTIDDLHLVSNILEPQGYHVRALAHGSMVLRSVQAAPPDLILLDIMMPDMDGYAVCEALQADVQTRTIPIIFLSALDDVVDKVRGFAAGGVDYIAKPFQAEEMLARVATHLHMRRMQQQLEAQNARLQEQITERQRAEAALRESQHFITRITETIPTLVYVYDLQEQHMVYINRQEPLLFACMHEVLRQQNSKPGQVCIHPDDMPRVLAHIEQFAGVSDESILECVYRVNHGAARWRWLHQYDMLFNRTPDGQPCQIVGTAIDITEQQHTLKLLRQQDQVLVMLRERERLTRELHDTLGQVLATINTQTQAVRDLLVNGRLNMALPLLSAVIEMTQEAQGDVRDFIIGTRTGQGLQQANQEQQGLLVGLQEHAHWLEDLYGFRTELHIAEAVAATRLSPITSMHLLRIVQEALTNVRKHAGVSLARVALALEDGWLQIRIEDMGKGFAQASGGQGSGSAGYGLHSMRQRAQEIGGELHIQSQAGSGTRILVQVPAAGPSVPSDLSLRLLLVDDNSLFLGGLRSLLEARHMQVVGVASNGSEALEQARRLRPDVILMDIEMPGMDGLEATRRIQAELPDIQIVMLTVADDDEHVFEAIKNGASGYLTKNLAADELCQLLLGLSHGEVPLSPGLAGRVLREFANQPATAARPKTAPRLSERQQQILTLVAQGHTYKQVGQMLNYSEATIKYHMGVVIKRLHLRNRADAVDYVRRQMARGTWPDLPPGEEQ